jgi:hypothetical protein
VKSQRWTDVTRRPQASVVVDAGDGYDELRGVEIIGQLELVGEAPRSSTPDAQLEEPERLFGAKYIGGTFQPDGRHAWMRLSPEKIVSWDFGKLMG